MGEELGGGRGNYNQSILYERRIYFQQKEKYNNKKHDVRHFQEMEGPVSGVKVMTLSPTQTD